MFFTNDSPAFLKKISILICTFLLLTVSFSIYVNFEKQIGQAHKLRYISFRLANQLHHSSDDLTQMARAYVATSKPQYKEYFYEIIDIRDGHKSLPKGYLNIYWAMVLADNQPDKYENVNISLLEMMRQAGFTESELNKLHDAKVYSDNLVNVEVDAMNLVASNDMNVETNRAKATMMLYDENYYHLKAKIMDAINQVYDLVNTRTQAKIAANERKAFIIRIVLITISLTFLFVLWRFYLSLHKMLGGSVDKIHELMTRIGRGDFSSTINFTPNIENSVLAGLYKMQEKLHNHEVERTEVSEELRIAAAAFESQEAMMITDTNLVVLRVNQAFVRMSGYSAEEVIGRTYRILQLGHHDKTFYRKMWKHIKRTGGWQGEIRDRRKNGEIYPKWLNISAIKDKDGTTTHYMGIHTDITARKKAEESIRKLAFFDQLTNLPNRTLLRDRLKQTMLASSRNGKYNALLFIDLDNFKLLNDAHGHNVGDVLLKQVAQRLTSCIRKEDTAARLGGDEFVVMLRSLSIDKEIAVSQAEHIARKILMTLNENYQLDNILYHNTSSFGITMFNSDQIAPDDLMKQADLAMYKSKEKGRNTLHFYVSDLEINALNRAELANDLREAIQKKCFLLHYQVQIDKNNSVIGAEVLVRWKHPQRGLMSPDEFIPLAEEIGLIIPLDYWVLETACTQLAAWATNPQMAHLTIAVNVSARQLHQHDFVSQVKAIVNKTGANPLRLKMELTESMLVKNIEAVKQKMFSLKSIGIGFALDDFGTGYSSLSYLRWLPLDWLKIDCSFVHDILLDSNNAAIVRTIIALSQNLNLAVIAEGVETIEQRKFLANEGCHACQGYLFGRPLPLEDFERLVFSISAEVEGILTHRADLFKEVANSAC